MAESNTSVRWPAYRRVPPFLPVPLRARADGWTAERQADFIGYLAETGSVAEAARRVGMSRMAAYRLRRRPDAESLAHAWDVAISAWNGNQVPQRKVTFAELPRLALQGPFTVHIVRGRFVRGERKPCDRATLRFLRWAGAERARKGRRGR